MRAISALIISVAMLLPGGGAKAAEYTAGAAGTGPSGLLSRYGYFCDAADAPERPFLEREVVIERLRGLPFWPAARQALR
jgi:hypothetical protein